jgi:hypothetical protein
MKRISHKKAQAFCAFLWLNSCIMNKVQARGGSLNGPGPAIAGAMLFVTSGYASNGIPGNVLLAFSVDGK